MDELRADDPRWIGAYRLLGRLGVGGMGRVYLARSERGRTVAVKLVRPELAEQDEFRTRFRREVQAARRVGGRWTAPVLDADTEAAIPWVATGYVAGPSLQQVVGHEYGPLPERSVRVLASGLAHALADIHAAGLVHRDLKPSNVMITIDGPRVIDFGIARALETVADASLTRTGAMVGSPAFMSPEQVRGDRVTPACDIFCLGSVLAYAATGLQPFGAAGSGVHAQMFRIVQERPDLEAVPEGLRELVSACLAKEPQARPSLAEVRRLLGKDGSDGERGDGGDGGDTDGRDDGSEPWLPSAIVARLGRHAVQLLELESEAEEPGFAPTEAKPAEPTGVPEHTATEVTPPRPLPPTAYSPTYVSQPAPAGVPPLRPSAPQPGDTPAPASSGARRRRGPLLTAVVALVLLAGGATAYIATQAGGGGSADPAPKSPGGTTAPAHRPGVSASDVPAGMVGTWRTSFTSADEGDNTRTLTVRSDGSVELSGDSATYSCFWEMRVVSAGPPVALSPSKVTGGEPVSSCSAGDATTLILVDAIHLRRDNIDSGKAPLTYEKVG
jgi:eukaryotic-like serine/threonine-protein kinase